MKAFLFPLRMPTFHNQLRLFREGRLSPWEPEHAKWIKQELASLEIDDPEDAARFRDLYEKRLADYIESQLPAEPISQTGMAVVVEPVVSAATVVSAAPSAPVTETVVAEVPKPKKAHKKPASPSAK